MALRSSWLGGTQLAVAMVAFIVIVTLCAILSLGKINNERQYDGRSAAAWLVSSTDTSAKTRATAAAALDYLWPEAGPLHPEIVRVEVSLLNDSYPEVRDEATVSLAGMATESPDVVAAVVAVLVRSPRLETRVQAAHVLGAAGPAAGAAAPALAEAASASEPSLRVAAVAALGDVGAGRDRSVMAALVRATDDPDENVRTVAMESLVDARADPGMLVSLAGRALRDPVAGVRQEAAYVLAASADTSAATRAALRDALADSDSTVRHLVQRALTRRQERTTRGAGAGSAR